MTDLEKIKTLFDDIGIQYTISSFNDEIRLYISENMICQYYDNVVNIKFTVNEKFVEFEGSGE